MDDSCTPATEGKKSRHGKTGTISLRRYMKMMERLISLNIWRSHTSSRVLGWISKKYLWIYASKVNY